MLSSQPCEWTKPLPTYLACAVLFNFLAIKLATGLKEVSSMNKEEKRLRWKSMRNLDVSYTSRTVVRKGKYLFSPGLKSPHILLFCFFLPWKLRRCDKSCPTQKPTRQRFDGWSVLYPVALEHKLDRFALFLFFLWAAIALKTQLKGALYSIQ